MPPKTRTERTPKTDPQLMSNRRTALLLGFSGFVFMATTLYGFQTYGQKYIPVPHLHSLTDRLVWTLRYQVFGLFAVIWSLIQVSMNRAISPAINPLSGHESVVEKSNKILTNTLEQFVVNVFNLLILSTYLSENNLRVIPLLSLYFLIGRIAFWVGYQIAPKYRAFGFTLTFWPTFVVFGLNCYFMFTTNTNYLFDGGKPFGRV